MYRLIKSMFIVSALTGLWGCAGIEQPADTSMSMFDNGDAGLNTVFLAQRIGIKSKPVLISEEAEARFNAPMGFRISPTTDAEPQLRGLKSNSAIDRENRQRADQSAQMENGVRVYRPFSKPRPKAIPHIHYQPMPHQTVAKPVPMQEYVFDASMRVEPQHSDDLDVSYVKMGGGSDIADWQACERQAGGFVVYDVAGYKIDSVFDNCMRARGYKPESEAKLELAGK